MLNGLHKNQLAISAGVIFVAVAIGGGVYWQLAAPRETAPIPSTQPNEQPEISSIVGSIKQLVDIPSNETPTVATVTDQDKVRSQPFFASAETGDKIVVFAEAKKAVLFRPSSGKIVNIATLTGEQIGEASASTQESQVTIVIRNGTDKSGLAGKIEDQIKKVVPQAQTKTENASKSNFEVSSMSVLNEQRRQIAEKLADELRIPIGSGIPEGEKDPKTDILIILGKDKVE